MAQDAIRFDQLSNDLNRPVSRKILVRCQTPEAYEEAAAILQGLRNTSLQVLKQGVRMELMVLQYSRPGPDGFEVRFTPGVVEALGSKLEPMELLRKAAQVAV